MASFVFHQLKQITLEHGSQAAAYKSLVGEHSKVVSALRKSFNFHRDSIDLAQRRRIQLLICYADELTECFYPWIDQVAQIFIPLLKFWFHWEVSMPELLRFAKLAVEKGTAFGQNVTYVKQPQQTLALVSLASINGQEAVLAHHSDACFDLIMMDLHMSVMNARQATKELRDMHVDSLIVGMTSRKTEEEEKSFMNTGLDYYYQKPLTIYVVRDLVEKINGNG
ncbi:hypothetical protein KY290_030432 [Solanum tuberosum]|uniref:Response regulatory domain-containing protein n=2 Tax=Solanum tuberosum TaxID=4113 RepID=A0ABQ7UNJ2_SOLTU|nr:hypothetical protein KY284_028862 [Solanum tuberosum]KAH0751200.1 hypothetical protein KY290_030432 [Solanum tuberosum]